MTPITLLALLASDAVACGGFFCNTEPVDQSGEVILFSVDSEQETVTMHVQVEFTGAAEDFAWVVPVPGTPELGLSHSVVFDELLGKAAPSYWMQEDKSGCEDEFDGYDDWADTDTDADADADTDADADADNESGVTVLATDTVGAYETTTLAADDSAALVEWLQDNDYDVPDQLDPYLEPYVADGMNFVALKLAAGASSGELAPLSLTYDGTTPVIPMQLTAIAATPDLPLTVYVLGDQRAVPDNYLHVTLHPLAIDYWSGGSNIDDVIRRGANEAGGHGFATELAVPAHDVSANFMGVSVYQAEKMRTHRDPYDWVTRLPVYDIEGTQEVLEVLRVHVPAPSHVDETSFYNFPSYYQSEYSQITDFDADAATDDLLEFEVQPRIEAQALLDDAGWVTRMRSSLSPEEMTLDPMFVLNPDVGQVEGSMVLTTDYLCGEYGDSLYSDEARQRLVYPHDQTVVIPSEEDLFALGLTPFEWVQREYDPAAALYIVQLGGSGEGVVVVDNGVGNDPDTAVNSAEGCACDSGAPSLAWFPAFGLLMLARRGGSAAD